MNREGNCLFLTLVHVATLNGKSSIWLHHRWLIFLHTFSTASRLFTVALLLKQFLF